MSHRNRLFSLLWPTWLGAILILQVWVWRHVGTPSKTADPTKSWPVASRLPKSPDRPSFLMFVGDDCPCSRAGLRELERLLAEIPEEGFPRVVVVFAGPQTDPVAELWKQAKGIAGVEAWRDSPLKETQRFGARTSGQVMTYDRFGTLVFEGGLTVARGHEGMSGARVSLANWFRRRNGSMPSQSRSRVFGCDLPDGKKIVRAESVVETEL